MNDDAPTTNRIAQWIAYSIVALFLIPAVALMLGLTIRLFRWAVG